MNRYAVYKNGKLVTCYERYKPAKVLALVCQDVYCYVAVVDMEDGALCYYWSY